MEKWSGDPTSNLNNLREFVVNSRHPKTPARCLGGSVLHLLTPFPRMPGIPGMSSKNGLFIVNNSIWGHACARMLLIIAFWDTHVPECCK